MIEDKDIQLLSKVWEIKPKHDVDLSEYEGEDISLCCKVKAKNRILIIYFNDDGEATSWDEIEEAQNTFDLIKIDNIANIKSTKNEILDYLNNNLSL